MAIKIEIYERTGSASSFTDTLVTNMNWKSQSLNDSLHKYYYYPIRLPIGTASSYSVPKYLYAKISGTYAGAKRVRWELKGARDPGVRLLFTQSDTYATPTANMKGDMTTLGDDVRSVIVPKLSKTGPTTSLLVPPVELTTNTTYYTNFLVTQLMLDSEANTVGNTEEYTVILTLDEYE